MPARRRRTPPSALTQERREQCRQIFFELGPKRTLAQVRRKALKRYGGPSLRVLREWSRKYGWVAAAQHHDAGTKPSPPSSSEVEPQPDLVFSVLPPDFATRYPAPENDQNSQVTSALAALQVYLSATNIELQAETRSDVNPAVKQAAGGREQVLDLDALAAKVERTGGPIDNLIADYDVRNDTADARATPAGARTDMEA